MVIQGSKTELGKNGIENLLVKGVENVDYLAIKVVQCHLSSK